MDKALYLEQEKILVIADLHLGYEEYLNKQGVFLPRFQYKKIIEDLDKIFLEVEKVKEIIILGDLKHEFGGILRQEWREVLNFLNYLKKKVKKIVLIKGNHDNYLINILKKEKIKIKDFYVSGELAFMHGHKMFSGILDKDKEIKKIFLGHLHPAIRISKGAKSEIYKCFLRGRWKGKEVVILPSFFPLVEGADVFIEDTNLDKKFNFNLNRFEVYVVGDKVYDFGKLGASKLARLI
jgi:hypothetical protein